MATCARCEMMLWSSLGKRKPYSIHVSSSSPDVVLTWYDSPTLDVFVASPMIPVHV